jgi:hypothetical protein
MVLIIQQLRTQSRVHLTVTRTEYILLVVELDKEVDMELLEIAPELTELEESLQ